ncbi:hypothetical protein BD311DRAFT_812388, partial [Dichomitus squalens]
HVARENCDKDTQSADSNDEDGDAEALALPSTGPLALDEDKDYSDGSDSDSDDEDGTAPSGSRSQNLLKLATQLESHKAMEKLLRHFLKRRKWPVGDKGADKKPEKGYSPPRENIALTSTQVGSMKRPLEGGEESTSKRVRSKS